MDFLPLEITKQILDFLDGRSRLNCRVVCTEWQKIIIINNFNINFVTRDQLSEVIDKLSKLTHPIGLTLSKTNFKNIGPSDTFTELLEISRLTNLTKFIIPDQDYYLPIASWIRLTTLTNLKRLDIFPDRSRVQQELMPHLPNLAWIDGFYRNILPLLPSLTNLQSLKMELTQRAGSHEPLDVQVFELLKFPGKLTSLAVNMYGAIMLELDAVTRLTGLQRLSWNSHQQFPHSLLPNLESLVQTGRPKILSLEDRLFSPKLTRLKFQTSTATSLTDLASLTKLKSLAIDFTGDRAIEPMEYLTALTRLEDLTFTCNNIDTAFASFVGSMHLTRLILTSKSLEITEHISRLITVESAKFRNTKNADFLTQLINLTSLQLLQNESTDHLFVSTLTKLKKLSIQHSRPLKLGFTLGDLTNLERLHLNVLVTGVDARIAGLDALTRLTHLYVVNEDTDLGLVTKTDLKCLYEPRRTKDFWNEITRLSGLEDLTINDKVDKTRALSLKQLPKLTRLVRTYVPVLPEIQAHLTHIYKLI